jgi:hypothetical protein
MGVVFGRPIPRKTRGGCARVGAASASYQQAGVPVGGTFEIPGRCGPAGTVSNYVECPKNGEWRVAGEGSACHYVGLEAPTESSCAAGCVSFGKCAIIGRRQTCKRTAFKGDPVECCRKMHRGSGDAMHGGKTCDPKHDRSKPGGDCDKILQAYCSRNTRAYFDDPVCVELAGKNMPMAEVGVRAACKAHPDEKRCACFAATAEYAARPGLRAVPPECVDARCTAGDAYLTPQQQRRACNVTLCDISQNDLSAVGGNLSRASVQIIQQCGPADEAPAPVPAPGRVAPPPEAPPPDAPPPEPPALLARPEVVLPAAAALVFLLAVGIFLVKR